MFYNAININLFGLQSKTLLYKRALTHFINIWFSYTELHISTVCGM